MSRKSRKAFANNLKRMKAVQRARILAGLCAQCGRNMHPKSVHLCLRCLQMKREFKRLSTGCQPWRPGGRGRPPVEATRKRGTWK